MADYISREAAIDAAKDGADEWDGGYNPVREACIRSAILNIPAADVVEVVRCKDCRYFHNGYDEKCCINHKGIVVTDENGFCHHAERRADNG